MTAIGAALINDLHAARDLAATPLARTLEFGLDAGALGAIVSGSGPTCAFLADPHAHSHEVAEALGVSAGSGRPRAPTGRCRSAGAR